MSEIAPPAYNAPPPGDHRIDDNQLPPPNYTVPTSFKIGQSRTSEPLVKISEIKGHLALLHAFAELKKRVDGDEATVQVAPNVTLNRERRWTWFVGVAVERYVPNIYSLRCFALSKGAVAPSFDIWAQSLKAADAKKTTEVVMPPLDVIMVWHAYMLNPRYTSFLGMGCGCTE